MLFGYSITLLNIEVVVWLFSQSCGYRSAQERAATLRVEDTPRGEMLMPPSEPVADANDLPREVHIELQQMVEDAQQEEDRNPAPPSPQPTSSIVRPAGGE